MNLSLIENVLRCPFCGQQLDVTSADTVAKRMEYGILTCDCSRFPVVAGIPVLQRNKKSLDAISFVESGRYSDSVLTMIQPERLPLSPVWKLASCLPFGSRLREAVHQRILQTWRARFAARLRGMDDGSGMTVSELLASYFVNKEHCNYFAYRFAQPRYFVALSCSSLVRDLPQMVLDFGCGQGHVTRSLVYQANGRQVIGVDRAFWGLYVAKRWIAPDAAYVCCSAENALPFADNTFSAVFSSDAFHYVVNKRFCVQEFNRITEDGVIVLAWVHNRRVRVPYDGIPLPPEGYHRLFKHMPHRIVADEDILSRYLQKQGPNLSMQPETQYLNQKPLLSIVASPHSERFRDYGMFVEPPHAKGRLGINPLYKVEVGENEGERVRLRRRFPSRFFEDEHAECKNFMPDEVETDSATLRDLAEGNRTAAIESLIERYILLGMPDNFCRGPQLPSVVRVSPLVPGGPENNDPQPRKAA
jgi:SAM-dependent methyltransferase/uncharacterized protein YbaR (Trm112 family)